MAETAPLVSMFLPKVTSAWEVASGWPGTETAGGEL